MRLWGGIFLVIAGLLLVGCSRSDSGDLGPMESLRAAAEKGDAKAQNLLGTEYFSGELVAVDMERAVYWFQKAADNGNSMAMYNLGVLYLNGNFLTEDYGKAHHYFSEAARLGLPAAQTSLGLLYVKGIGVKKNMEEAVYWYRRAATFGKEADVSRSYYEGHLLPHRQRQYLFGDPDAQFLLAGLLVEGKDGVKEDIQEAIRFYEDAASQGDGASMHQLALLYGLRGKDLISGYAWAKLAARDSDDTSRIRTLSIITSKLELNQRESADNLASQFAAVIEKNRTSL